MKIALITGSLPPEPCGVGDYTYNLYNALKSKKNKCGDYSTKNWSYKNIKLLTKNLKEFDIIHLQYPTLGFGYSLGPHLVSLVKPLIVTIHEASQAHLLRFFLLFAFTIRSLTLIFTTKYEKEYFEKFYPYVKKKTVVIPIGSNIPFSNYEKERKKEIVYFGLIAPNKNLEDFIELCQFIVNNNLKISIRIIGKIRDYKYYNLLLYKSKNLPIIWSIDLKEVEVCKILSKSLFAYLPFPDGASERRGTLLATLGNGVITITTDGPFVTEEMREVILLAKNSFEAFCIVKELYNKENQLKEISKKSMEYASKFSWDKIAERHIYLYEKIVKSDNTI